MKMEEKDILDEKDIYQILMDGVEVLIELFNIINKHDIYDADIKMEMLEHFANSGDLSLDLFTSLEEEMDDIVARYVLHREIHDLEFDPVLFKSALNLFKVRRFSDLPWRFGTNIVPSQFLRGNRSINLAMYLYKHNQINYTNINIITDEHVPINWSIINPNILQLFLDNGLDPIYIAISIAYNPDETALHIDLEQLDSVMTLLDMYGIDWFAPVSIDENGVFIRYGEEDDIQLVDHILDQLYTYSPNIEIMEYIQNRIYKKKFEAMNLISDLENIVKDFRYGFK